VRSGEAEAGLLVPRRVRSEEAEAGQIRLVARRVRSGAAEAGLLVPRRVRRRALPARNGWRRARLAGAEADLLSPRLMSEAGLMGPLGLDMNEYHNIYMMVVSVTSVFPHVIMSVTYCPDSVSDGTVMPTIIVTDGITSTVAASL
jgi:hypothetical protein